MKKKNAFTLAEVLITLGIIGIVAAMTLPVLIEKHQKVVHVNRMKQTYSILANAFYMARQEYGEPKNWDWDANNLSEENLNRFIEKYLLPYLSVSSTGGEHESWENSYVCRLKNGTTMIIQFDGYNKDGIPNGPVTDITALRFLISHKSETSSFTAQNRDYSRNNYLLVFSKNEGLKFANYNKSRDRDYYINNGSQACNKNIVKNKRLSCGALIFYDGWEIKDDYPW